MDPLWLGRGASFRLLLQPSYEHLTLFRSVRTNRTLERLVSLLQYSPAKWLGIARALKVVGLYNFNGKEKIYCIVLNSQGN